jgi:hypothetical protein
MAASGYITIQRLLGTVSEDSAGFSTATSHGLCESLSLEHSGYAVTLAVLVVVIGQVVRIAVAAVQVVTMRAALGLVTKSILAPPPSDEYQDIASRRS